MSSVSSHDNKTLVKSNLQNMEPLGQIVLHSWHVGKRETCLNTYKVCWVLVYPQGNQKQDETRLLIFRVQNDPWRLSFISISFSSLSLLWQPEEKADQLAECLQGCVFKVRAMHTLRHGPWCCTWCGGGVLIEGVSWKWPQPHPPAGRRHKWSLSMEVIWTPLRMLINIAN